MSRGNVIVCPKCRGIGRLHAYHIKSNVYYVVYHGVKDGKHLRCYLGAEEYRYVTGVHDFELRGALDSRRYTDYLLFIVEVLSENLRIDIKGKDDIARGLADVYVDITELLIRLSSDDSVDSSVRRLVSEVLMKARDLIEKSGVSVSEV